MYHHRKVVVVIPTHHDRYAVVASKGIEDIAIVAFAIACEKNILDLRAKGIGLAFVKQSVTHL